MQDGRYFRCSSLIQNSFKTKTYGQMFGVEWGLLAGDTVPGRGRVVDTGTIDELAHRNVGFSRMIELSSLESPTA